MDEVLAKMYTKQVLCGLEYLHSLQIAHRDVKGKSDPGKFGKTLV